jgi:hypothetical protein
VVGYAIPISPLFKALPAAQSVLRVVTCPPHLIHEEAVRRVQVADTPRFAAQFAPRYQVPVRLNNQLPRRSRVEL